ncbi:MAG: CDP-alcohol phosphatidyltransferase family protein [Candidatus Paceibacterota bacterium]|jgi:phosphatidylglycerophosphate synthase
MESIKELRVKLQTNVLGHPILQRVLSIYITRVFLATDMTANQVSVLMLLVGVVGAVPFFFGYFWLGLALSYLGVLLDASDGEVARYRKTYSLQGIYIDLVNHLVTQELFFLGLGFAVAQSQSGWIQTAVLVFAVLGALALSVRRANGDLHRELFAHQYSDHPERFHLPTVTVQGSEMSDFDSEAPHASSGPINLVKRALYLSGYHAVMIVIVAVALIGEMVVLPGNHTHPVVALLVVFYASMWCIYLTREVVAGYYNVEKRVAAIKEKLASK